MTELEKYRDAFLGIFQEETKDLWKKEEDTEFLKQLTEDIANQKLQLLTADTEEKKVECRNNLEHLRTQLEGRIAAKKNDLIQKGDWILKKMCNVAIKMLISSLLA